MKNFHLAVLTIAILTLAGCGSMGIENKRVDYKSGTLKVPSLEIPPDLTAPATEDHYIIPNADGSVARYSDFSKGANASSTAVLPVSRNVHMERDGAQRWLVVDDKAENLWPVVKTFWQESGFVLKVEDPRAGIMETDWAENRAKIPKTGLRSVLGKVLDGLYESGELDMYRVRMERSKDNSSTEIYLSQYGKEEVVSTDETTTKWQSRPNDPELEATMLQMLMVKLGGAEAKATTGETAVQGAVAAPKLKTLDDGSTVIQLSEPFDRSWRVVGLALEHEGFVVEDKNRSSGVYFLQLKDKVKEKSWYDSLAFWRSDSKKAKPQRYQVTVLIAGEGCEVSASNAEGDFNQNSQDIIGKLYKALGK